MEYESTVLCSSDAFEGVTYRLQRMSFGGRLDLLERIRTKLTRLEFLSAGDQVVDEQAEAAQVAAEIDREYLVWGLAEIDGLSIDGAAVDVQALIEKGPEELVGEVLKQIRRSAGLSEDERKNSDSHFTSASEIHPGGAASNAAI